MRNNHAAYKYEMTYKGTFLINQCWTNIMVTLQCGAIKIRYNICHINPYTSDTNVEYTNPETNDWEHHIRKVPVTYLCLYILNIGTKCGNWMCT